MKHSILILVSLLIAQQARAQFPPPAGQPGTTAIAADSSAIVGWATACSLQLGWQDISNPALGVASVGDSSVVVGPPGTPPGGVPGGGIVSLGDGGVAILTFAQPIFNGPGWDFAVFENSFSDDYLELAFVEVSSNGIDFVRFPATSNTQVDTQVETYGSLDATLLDNLAGKYRGGFGTPFDLEQLVGEAGLDVNAITHVKVIDVVGSILDEYATYDSHGNKVNDPWKTAFPSSGFDLKAVGVIHQLITGIAETPLARICIFPNPVSNDGRVQFTLQHSTPVSITLCDAFGRTLVTIVDEQRAAGVHTVPLDVSTLAQGIYFVTLTTPQGNITERILIHHAQ